MSDGARPNFKLPFQVDLHIQEFEKLIEAHGHCVTWEKATLCPCIDADGKAHLKCAECSGQGWKYFDSLPITVLLISLSATKAFSDVGIAGDWVLGKVKITSQAGSNLGFRDRITSLDSQITFSELLIVGRNDKTRYNILAVEHVAIKGQELFEGTDFDIVSGQIVFTPDLPADSIVTVRYICHPRWVILDALHEIRDTTLQSGKFVRAPRAHLASLDYVVNLEVIQS